MIKTDRMAIWGCTEWTLPKALLLQQIVMFLPKFLIESQPIFKKSPFNSGPKSLSN